MSAGTGSEELGLCPGRSGLAPRGSRRLQAPHHGAPPAVPAAPGAAGAFAGRTTFILALHVPGILSSLSNHLSYLFLLLAWVANLPLLINL